jgi:nicotinamide-nucleotide amidase
LGRVHGASVQEAARILFKDLLEGGLSIVCAESCTGGMVASAITDIPGSSAVLWGGVVAYSNESKSRLLGVPPEAIAEFGAVSREVARAMAGGALDLGRGAWRGNHGEAGADLALAITGIAGPTGGSPEKPVGLVWFAFRSAAPGDIEGPAGLSSEEYAIFDGDRLSIREAAAERAMLRAAELARSLRSRPD